MEIIDLGFRAASWGILALLAMHLLLTRTCNCKTVSAFAMLLASGALLLTSTMAFEATILASPELMLMRMVVVALSPIFIAWGLIELFVDEFEFKKWQMAFIVLSVPTHFMNYIDPIFSVICHLTSIIIFMYLFYIAFTTIKHDLVEERLKFRKWFITGAALDGLLLTIGHWWYGDVLLPAWFHLFKSISMFALIMTFSYWALLIRDNLWAQTLGTSPQLSTELSPAETALLGKLQTSMKDNIWKQEGLTIRKLATLLDVPEHRLRKVINQGLGYRNFAAYLNEHRIEAACEVLCDPVKADTPVINIAFDLGYASLGPFNRAFREIVGESPTEYRRRAFS